MALRTTVARSRGKPLDLEASEFERGTLATFGNPEILEVNAAEHLSTRSSKYIVFTDTYLLGGFVELNGVKIRGGGKYFWMWVQTFSKGPHDSKGPLQRGPLRQFL